MLPKLCLGANTYLTSPNNGLALLDLTPRDKMLMGAEIDFTPFIKFSDYDLDFDGQEKGWEFRGAYVTEGPPLWMLDLVMRPELEDMTSGILDFFNVKPLSIEVFPNPNDGRFEIRMDGGFSSGSLIAVVTLDGREVYKSKLASNLGVIKLNLGQVESGSYVVLVKGDEGVYVGKIVVH